MLPRMPSPSGRIAWVALWLMLAVGAGIALVFFLGTKPPPPTTPTTVASSQPTATQATTTTTAPITIQTYGQLLHADLHNYPDTRPWGMPVDLTDAAHIILHEPIYICSRGDLWLTRPDADPLPTVLARAANESEHIVDRQISYVIWTPDHHGVWQPAAICPTPAGFEIVSPKSTQAIPWHRHYLWDRAMTWQDNDTTRLIVPTDTGMSIITLDPTTPHEDYCELAPANSTTRPTPTTSPAPAVLFDTRGLLAWIPADDHFAQTSVARYLDGKWSTLDPASWPGDIVYLVPLLDGSVLQIRHEPGDSALTFISLDSPGIDEKEIGALVDQLGDDDPDKRVAAYQRLAQYGPRINPVLEKLAPNAAPEAQARIQEILRHTTLGGMSVTANQLQLTTRLRDGGMVFLAPQGVSIPQEGQDPKVVTPDYLAVRPGRPVQELPAVAVDPLTKSNGQVAAWADEWLVTTSDAGPQRFLPPDQLQPLLLPSERSFTRFIAIDSRGRWLFADDNSHRTLILDPTVPDPTPRLAIWLVDTGTTSGWNKAGWPSVKRGTSQWLIDDHDFEPIDKPEDFQTDFPLVLYSAYSSTMPSAPPATSPDSAAGFGQPLMMDELGNRYYDGKSTITWVDRSGKPNDWPLPDTAASATDDPAYLAEDHDGHFLLFNTTGRIARLRRGAPGEKPFELEAVFANKVPDFENIKRIWCDPAGRICVAYEESHLAIIFPTGQIPHEIEDKILPQDLFASTHHDFTKN